jgi:hypothetical protein
MKTKLNKIKIFSDENIAALERKINSWFKENKFIEFVQILQSETVTNLESDPTNGSLNRTITICYKDTENPSIATNESVSQNKASIEKETSSAITESVKSKKVSQKADDLEFLYEQLQDSSESVS